MRYVTMLALLLFVVPIGFSATYYVPDDYGSIQDAIDQALDGDSIIVRPGVYFENIDYSGKTLSVQSEQGAEHTIIDGGQAGSTVVFQTGESPGTLFEGFTVTNGSGTLSEAGLLGGGIYCGGEASPTIRKNIIIGNTARHGGGLYTSWSPEVQENIISGNTASAGEGGGIFTYLSGSPRFERNLVTGNTASYGGGGIAMYENSHGLIANNIIVQNQVSFGNGGGISLEFDCAVTIENNMIIGNQVKYRGGGIDVTSDSCALIVNNTISGNSANNGGGISCRTHSLIEVVNTILWSNTCNFSGPEIYLATQYQPSECSISYSDIEGGQSSVYYANGCTLHWGSGMIDMDPLFVDLDGPDNNPDTWEDNDLHIRYTSPCKDAGDDTAASGQDFEGDQRFDTDMGADEFCTHLYYKGHCAPGGSVELKFIGQPGTTPVQIWLGSGVLDPPTTTKYGDWYLQFPLLANVELGSIPGPDGVMVLPFTIPATAPTPLSLPFQAGIGMELTNVSVLEVE